MRNGNVYDVGVYDNINIYSEPGVRAPTPRGTGGCLYHNALVRARTKGYNNNNTVRDRFIEGLDRTRPDIELDCDKTVLIHFYVSDGDVKSIHNLRRG